MAITRLNSLAIPAGTVEPADISYPLTNFSSTGIDDNANANAITIDSSENVGIGTLLPTLNAAWKTLYIDNTTDSYDSRIVLRGGGSNKNSLILTSGTYSSATGYPATIQYTNSLRFFSVTDENETGATEHVRIDSSGKVGIGTDAPSTKLHVSGGINTGPAAAGSTDAALIVSNNDSSYGIHMNVNGSTGAGFISAQRNDGTATTYDLSLQPNGGLLGVGIAAPASILHLNGTDPIVTLTDSSATVGEKGFRIAFDNGRLTFQRASDTGAFEANYLAIMQDTGYVGIGTTEPQHFLDINVGAGGAPTYKGHLRLDGGALGNSGHGGLEFTGSTYGSGYGWKIVNEDPGGQTPLVIYSRENSATWTEIARFRGNAVGGGLAFNGDTAAANALDDYEEGSWTPALRTSNLDGSYTIGAIQSAKYTKIGNVVHYSFYCTNLNRNSGGTGTGTMQITGLPYNSLGSLYSGGLTTYGVPIANGKGSRHIVQSGNSYLRLIDDSTGVDLGVNQWVNASNVIIVGKYWVA